MIKAGCAIIYLVVGAVIGFAVCALLTMGKMAEGKQMPGIKDVTVSE
jgi:hypothetical protein